MRRIVKGQPPACLQDFIQAQQQIEPEPVNLTYRDFRAKAELLSALTAEQFGLCGYTGSGVDDGRISRLMGADGENVFLNHVEHLKSQRTCRDELKAAGHQVGRDLGQDLDYANVIAALEVRGAQKEQFGASIKAAQALPVLPTQIDCEQRFRYREDGVVEGLDDHAVTTIARLLLNHDTLQGWRQRALRAWLDPQVVQSANDLRDVIAAVSLPRDGTLPEFAFVIEAVARSYLGETDL